MYSFRAKSSFLTRDRKLFLELSQAEVDCWIPRVFDKIRPQMLALNALLFDADEPANLVMILDLSMDQVREVAREMAGGLLTPYRLRSLRPLLEAYCDELLSTGHERDAAFVQMGLIQMADGQLPGQISLLVEICAQAIYQQIDEMSIIGRTAPKAL